MHPITAKLITLERVEAFVTSGWPKGARSPLRDQAKLLRGELPPHILSVFDRLKAEGKEAVVGVFDKKCGGCHAPLSKVAWALLSKETELNRCPLCKRFIYLSESLVSDSQPVGAEGTKYAS
jgi:predicted  nucleic acid-binding Zn-ribbon protein